MITIRPLISALDPDASTADEAHIWTTSSEVNPSERAALWQELAKDERERAPRYRFDIDRRRVIAARGRLRQVLAYYLHVLPGDVVSHYGAFGKPAPAATAASLQFNVSHAGGWALFAVGGDRSLGIDLEPWDIPIAYRISVLEPTPRPLPLGPLGGGISHWTADISSPPNGRGLRGGRSKIIASRRG